MNVHKYCICIFICICMRIRIRILYIHMYMNTYVHDCVCVYIYICLYICTSMYVCTLGMWIRYPSWGYLVTKKPWRLCWDQHWPRFARCKAYQIGEDSADNAALARHLGLMLRISRKKHLKKWVEICQKDRVSMGKCPFLGWYNWYFTNLYQTLGVDHVAAACCSLLVEAK